MTAQPPDNTPDDASRSAGGWVLAGDLFVLTLALAAAVALVLTHNASAGLLTAVGAFVVTILTAWHHRRER
ncbi:hypothetical protein [Nocardia alni]|uniref:hypothetical protein n=1 Tax=Nocardia alni TaxID=2815723 RepID=UPI001C23EA19|nr:hypothetical protein [Nocardia alni]